MSTKSYQAGKILFVAGLLLAGLIFWVVKANQTPVSGSLQGKSAVVYRSITCGCCANYISYLRRAGAQVEEKITEDMPAIKKQFGVPSDLSSCHTTIIDGYVVEGHIPVEAIVKLLTERPVIAGIALPDMPVGSPGMPGKKFGTFNISSFTAVGLSSLYLSL